MEPPRQSPTLSRVIKTALLVIAIVLAYWIFAALTYGCAARKPHAWDGSTMHCKQISVNVKERSQTFECRDGGKRFVMVISEEEKK